MTSLERDDDDVIDPESAEYIQSLAYTEGKLKSPIDLSISDMTQIELEPLQWYNYDIPPKKMKLTNTGRTVVLSAKWERERAYLIGGPFLQSFVFSQIHFHWGETDMIGSEHFVDGGSMPMELHAVHFKSDYASQEEALRNPDGISILVYFFKVILSKLELPRNFILEMLHNSCRMLKILMSKRYCRHLISLGLLRVLGICENFVQICQCTLAYLQGTNWHNIPARNPLIQIMQFRTLLDADDKPISYNCHPLQDKEGRSLFYVSPRGSNYATLLPIPRSFLFDNKHASNVNKEDRKVEDSDAS